MAYLRGVRNAKTLRNVVLAEFIHLGQTEHTSSAPPSWSPRPEPQPPVEQPQSLARPDGDQRVHKHPDSPDRSQRRPRIDRRVVRDEEWLVTKAEQGSDGWLVQVRGLSELVAETTAAFYSSLDKIEPQDPETAKVVADGSSGYRDSRLWLEALLRKTPVPYGDQSLTVSTHMLADALGYQKAAVTKALDPEHIRPRILIADAVGLGKTIEIGMILSELVRRGRGERILIVTPKHVLEQMQHELWCRFALPFVRLDSAGIQKVRQKLPATRNPFTYFKRAIISIDTLKSPRYKAHLERQQWDAVVIDESHNLTNVGTQNNELARVLAPNTEALILASATPHNGREESFAELLRLLDPTVVKPDGTFTKEDVESLLIRRHRHSPDVAAEVGSDWAERAEPVHRLVETVSRPRTRWPPNCPRPGCTQTAERRHTPATPRRCSHGRWRRRFCHRRRHSPSRSSSAATSSTPPDKDQKRELAALQSSGRTQRQGAQRAGRQVRRARAAPERDRRGGRIEDAGCRVRRAGRDPALAP